MVGMIREMRATDIEAIQHVAAISWHATYENIIPRDVQRNFLQLAYSKERLLQRMVETNFYVAIAEDEIIGFANFSSVRANGQVDLSAIYVLPSKQGKAIGSNLLAHGIQQLQPSVITLNVEKENLIGRQFYNGKGFTVVREFDEPFLGYTLKMVTYRKDFA